MHKNVLRTVLVLALIAVVAVSAAALIAGSRRADELEPGDQQDEAYRARPEQPFQQCPSPPCMAPCRIGVPPEVLCKVADGSVQATTYHCCCCGSAGNQYKPLN
jgi:hypothetical protein